MMCRDLELPGFARKRMLGNYFRGENGSDFAGNFS